MPGHRARDVTELLLAWNAGEPGALERLVPLVYGELRRLAHRHMLGERPGHALQTIALVHEAYLRLVDGSRIRWQNRAQFFAVSAQVMRRILVDAARAPSASFRRRCGARARPARGWARTVAIEILPAGLATNPDRRARFEREAKTISQLNHPHICTLFDIGEAALASTEPRTARGAPISSGTATSRSTSSGGPWTTRIPRCVLRHLGGSGPCLAVS